MSVDERNAERQDGFSLDRVGVVGKTNPRSLGQPRPSRSAIFNMLAFHQETFVKLALFRVSQI